MTNCNKISELLSAYMDDELTNKEKELVENHLQSCATCKQKLDLMLKTRDILKSSPQIPVPETLLKDFEEYRKKTEQSEKKIVPLYKNYRVYASIAAVFIFAFVLKSGLWQEDKFVPDTLTQTKVSQQTLSAGDNDKAETQMPENSSVAETKAVTAKEKTVSPSAIENQETKTQPVQERIISSKPVPLQEYTTDVALATDSSSEQSSAPATASVASAENSAVAAHDGTENVAPMTRRTMDMPQEDTQVEKPEAPAYAIVYVAEEHLAKAARLLSEGKYFYAQVEQKLSDNRIPFESNFLSLDEGIPHKVVVMTKE